MDPVRDDLDERVQHAALPDEAAVERVVRVALSPQPGGLLAWRGEAPTGLSVREWPAAFAVATACLAGVISLGVWWCVPRRATASEGAYRVGSVSSVAPDGVYRADASPTVAPSRVIRVTADDGTTWILSTTPTDDWLPPGSGIVVGGGEAR